MDDPIFGGQYHRKSYWLRLGGAWHGAVMLSMYTCLYQFYQGQMGQVFCHHHKLY